MLLLFQFLPGSRGLRNSCLLVAVGLLHLLFALLGALTLEVDDRAVRLRFGLGVVRKSFTSADVASCRPVRNKWYWGWGIRLIPTAGFEGRHCWLYLVSGLDAVEPPMTDGRTFRICTDGPHRLSDFIQAGLNKLA